MIRHLLLPAVLALMFVACKPSGLQTIEEGETYAQAHGVVITSKTEDTKQRVAPRSYDYKANGAVEFGITQFASENAASTWKKAADDIPFGGSETRIQKGVVIFTVWGATDNERQTVIDALK